jgi:5'-AMP-activated protein kinase, regulatory beta subunit
LDKDLQASNAGEAMRVMNTTGAAQPTHDTPNDRELERLREFTQQLPDRRDFGLFFEKFFMFDFLIFLWNIILEKASNPPILPPHLLQVRFNILKLIKYFIF